MTVARPPKPVLGPVGRRRGDSLRFAYCPTHVDELDRLVERHACAACGETSAYVAGDQGPQKRNGPIVYYRAVLRCSCGFTNYVNVVVNDLPLNGLKTTLSSQEALHAAEEAGLMPNPEAEELLIGTAAAYHRQDWEEAGKLVQACLEVDRGNPAAWYNRGILLAGCGEDDGAIEAFNKTLEVSNDFPSAWMRLGEIHHRHGELERAAACVERFLKRHPDNADAQNLLALCRNATPMS